VEIWLVDESSGGEWRQARVMRRLCLLECASHSHESVRYYELRKGPQQMGRVASHGPTPTPTQKPIL
jgi:hypothetical protein